MSEEEDLRRMLTRSDGHDATEWDKEKNRMAARPARVDAVYKGQNIHLTPEETLIAWRILNELHDSYAYLPNKMLRRIEELLDTYATRRAPAVAKEAAWKTDCNNKRWLYGKGTKPEMRERNIKIIRGLQAGKTLGAVGEEVGLTKASVAQVRDKLLRRIKRTLWIRFRIAKPGEREDWERYEREREQDGINRRNLLKRVKEMQREGVPPEKMYWDVRGRTIN